LAVAMKSVSPARRRPSGLEKLARAIWAQVLGLTVTENAFYHPVCTML